MNDRKEKGEEVRRGKKRKGRISQPLGTVQRKVQGRHKEDRRRRIKTFKDKERA